MKKPNAIESARQKAARNRELIIALLDWSEETLQSMFIESALEYLDRQFGPDLEGIRLLREGDLFWPWFKNHWDRLDAIFIDECLDDRHLLDDIRAYYKHKHSGSNMRFKPHKNMMAKTFAKVKKEVEA